MEGKGEKDVLYIHIHDILKMSLQVIDSLIQCKQQFLNIYSDQQRNKLVGYIYDKDDSEYVNLLKELCKLDYIMQQYSLLKKEISI